MAQAIYIIAEAGVNHNGSVDLARDLVRTAAEAGVDAVKFQIFQADKLVSPEAEKADYQKAATSGEEGQYAMLKKLELSYDAFTDLKRLANELGIDFLSTAFDLESIDFLVGLGVRYLKVPSGEITNYPYLVKTAQTGLPVILSTGMSTLQDIEAACDLLSSHGSGDIILLHCTTAYPTPMEEVNLRAMNTLAASFNRPVGYSDHTQGIAVPVAAAALGAVVIEKHFTLDRSLPGPDHTASLEPDELAEMVRLIRQVSLALGSGEKRPSPSEEKNMAAARRSVVAARDIRKGEPFTEANLTCKRPGDGLSPMFWPSILGQTAARDFTQDEKISL